MSSEIFDSLKTRAANVSPFNAKLKFVLEDEIILVDGSDGKVNIVTTDDIDADTVIICTKETFLKLQEGELNPMMAVMTGKVKIKGDMGLAMKLQSLI